MISDVLVEQLTSMLRQQDLKLRTAESCTAGGIAARIAAVAGVSDVLDRGWVTYSNASKIEELDVDASLIHQYGAVSSEVALAMAEGGAARDAVCVAVSGVAGPSGGSIDKPVGTVCIAVVLLQRVRVAQCFHFTGDRLSIQQQSVEQSIQMLIQALQDLYI